VRAHTRLANISFTPVSRVEAEGSQREQQVVGGVAPVSGDRGSLIPIALNIQLGAGTASAITSGPVLSPKVTNILAGAGLA